MKYNNFEENIFSVEDNSLFDIDFDQSRSE